MKNIIKCTFTSVWSESDDVVTDATYDPNTGEVSAEQSKKRVKGCLVREYITLPDEEEMEVCMDCHEYVVKTVMNSGSSHSYNEETVCSNPECDSNQ